MNSKELEINNQSSSSGGGGGGGGGTTSAGATSILEKYATLNNAITSTRAHITQIENQITNISNQTYSIQSENETMQNELKEQKLYTTPEMKQENSIIQKEYQSSKQNEIEAKQLLDMEKKRLSQMKEKKEELRVDFLSNCREFRMNIRKNRVCLEGLLGRDSATNPVNCTFGNVTTEDNISIGDSITYNTSSTTTPMRNYEVRIEYNRVHEGDQSGDVDDFTLSSNDSTLSASMICDVDGVSKATPMIMMTSSGTTSSKCISSSPIPKKSLMKQRHHSNSSIDYSKLSAGNNDDDGDDEMNRAVQNRRDASNFRSQIEKKLDTINVERKNLEDRARDRAKQLEQQRSQLETLRHGIQEMQRETTNLEENTVECSHISQGYKQDVWRRNKKPKPSTYSSSFQSVTQSNPFSGSYHRNDHFSNIKSQQSIKNNSTKWNGSTKVQNPYAKKQQNDTRDEMTKSNYGNTQAYRSSLAKQHPHRAGRIRVDKQFTTALSISPENFDDDDDDDDVLSNMLLSSKKTQMSSKVSIDDSSSVSAKQSVNIDFSSSDEDNNDDDILEFQPFS